MKSFRHLWKIACLSGLLFAACESTRSVGILDFPSLKPSPYIRIGTVTQIDTSSATAVVRLDHREISLSEELFVRNLQLNVVAVLRPTGIRTGKSVGMVIVKGEVTVNEEVVQKLSTELPF